VPQYKFNVVNMRKRDSLFNYGLRPLMLSTKLLLHSNIGWQRVGTQMRPRSPFKATCVALTEP
jgi:hypothetical protein